MSSSSASQYGLLPAPDTTPVSTVVYTRADNQVQMDGASVTVLIDGSDIVLKSADGKVLILPLAAQLASYERNLFKLVFADGRVMSSDDLLAAGKVVNVSISHAEKATEKSASPHETPQAVEKNVEKQVEKVVEKIVEKVIVIEPEPTAEPVKSTTTSGKIDALSLTKPLVAHSSDNEAPPLIRASSGSVHKSDAPQGLAPPVAPEAPTPKEPEPLAPQAPIAPIAHAEPTAPTEPAPTEPVPTEPTDSIVPTDPDVPKPPEAVGMLYQLDAIIDKTEHIYRGGAATDGAQSDSSLAMQYGVKNIDLSEETAGWTVFTDDPDRFSADTMTRVITLKGAFGAVHVTSGLPEGYTTAEFGTPLGDQYGLKTGEVLLLYPSGRHDSLALTFQFSDEQGAKKEAAISFVLTEAPFTVQRDDGTFLLASGHGKSYVSTGSGNDTVHAGFTNSEIHTGEGDDTIITSMAAATFDGGGGFDTVDYGAIGSALLVDMSLGTVAVSGNVLHSLIGVEQVIGSDFGNRMVMGDSDVVFRGGAGDDVFVSGRGNGVFDGAKGVNVIDFSRGSDSSGVVASLARGATEAGRNGAGGTDVFSNIQGIIGSQFNDSLEGDAMDNTIFAGAGDDRVIGSGGADVLDGGSGSNKLDYSSATANLQIDLINGLVNKGEDINGQAQIDRISNFIEVTGGQGADTFKTISGAVLRGGAGNDTFIGGLGPNTFDGGLDRDVVDYSNLSNALYVNLNTGVATELTIPRVNGILTFGSTSGGTFVRDTLISVEDVVGSLTGTNYLEGGAGDNKLVGGRNTNYLLGGGGNNLLDGSKGASDFALYSTATSGVRATLDAAKNGTVTHGANTDTLIGIEGLWGSAYDDVLSAANAAVYLYGGAGNNTLTGGTAYYNWGTSKGVIVDLGGGGHTGALENGFGSQDTLININRVVGSYNFDDIIWGNDNDNYITESSGNNVIYGSKGNDTLTLSGGSNTLNYSTLSVGIVADLSKASVIKGLLGAAGTDKLVGTGSSNITGTALVDKITGDSSNNILNGNGGADTLIGNAGSDILIGGADGLTMASYSTSPIGIVANLSTNQVSDGLGGTDTLIQIGKITGSANADQFTFSTQADLSRYQVNGGGGNDIMTKQGNGGSYSLDSSVHISGIKTIEFSDSKVDRITIDLNALFPGAGSSQNLTIHTDVADVVSVSQSGWTMTENAAHQQIWAHGSDTVTVSN